MKEGGELYAGKPIERVLRGDSGGGSSVVRRATSREGEESRGLGSIRDSPNYCLERA